MKLYVKTSVEMKKITYEWGSNILVGNEISIS